ncbi:MAG: hypothetical protein ACOYEV_17425, partial [Candidatus Nanopelagicales bacterium]
VHISGAASGASPPEPEPNQDNRFEPRPLTAPEADAARAVVALPAGGAAETEATAGAGAEDAGESLLAAAVVDVSAGAETDGATAGVSAVERDPLLPAEVAGTGEVLSELWRLGAAAAGALLPRTEESEPEASDAGDGALLPRPERRADVPALVDEPAAEAEESAEPVPVEPAEPVVSAKASGIAAKPEPTPRAMANAPTRPTYFA